MDYSFFLFTKLFDVVIGTKYEYDLMYQDLQGFYKDFSESLFNDSNRDEADCMVDYLKANRLVLLSR